MEWDSNFRLYLTTKLANPHYGPEGECSAHPHPAHLLHTQALLGTTIPTELPAGLPAARPSITNHATIICGLLSAAVSGKVSLINYGLTQPGLAQQLLEVVVAHERPDLAAARTELVASMSADKGQLALLEDTLLRELSSATGEIGHAGTQRHHV